MARPREFDEQAVLDLAVLCFWARGYEATSVKDLIEKTGITAASLYNAFGDKRTLYQKALDRYVEGSIADRIRRCERLAPREAISTLFAEILKPSLSDRKRKGCMLVNAALDAAAYATLAKPSTAVPPATYRSIEPNLFEHIIDRTTSGTDRAGTGAALRPPAEKARG